MYAGLGQMPIALRDLIMDRIRTVGREETRLRDLAAQAMASGQLGRARALAQQVSILMRSRGSLEYMLFR